MIEEAKALLDWIAGKEMWYWFTIAIAFAVIKNIFGDLFGDVYQFLKRKLKRTRRSKKTQPEEPKGRWANYE